MEASRVLLLFLPTIHSLLDSAIIHQLHHSKSHICEYGHPELVYYEANLSKPLQLVLNRYLQSVAEPITVVTTVERYIWDASYARCPLMFLEKGSLATELEFVVGHLKLIVTSTDSFASVNALFIKYNIYDTVFLVINGSQLVVHHYDKFSRKQNRWTALESNPLPEAARDLNGTKFVTNSHNSWELIFAEFLATNINATLVQQGGDIGMVYWSQITNREKMFNYIYMHRTSGLRVLVPRLDRPKPMIFVLVDPYDCETWMAYSAIILMFALLRMCSSRHFDLRQYVRSVQDIVSCAIFNSSIVFHRVLEQLNMGVFKLMNMVLMTAYESLVISFLLNPRFYPELDTLQQVNDSCCWTWTGLIGLLNFRHVDECPANDPDRFMCYLVDPIFEQELNGLLETESTVKNYRWSKLQMQPYPVMAVASGSVGLTQKLSFCAGVFFAEGALFRVFEVDEDNSGKGYSQMDRSVSIADLALLWKVYCCGIGLSLVAFIGELVVYKAREFRCRCES